MADITLGDGREITFDLSKITVEEYESLLSKGINREREKEILGSTCALTVDELKKMSLKDYKRLTLAFVKTAVSPVKEDASEKN